MEYIGHICQDYKTIHPCLFFSFLGRVSQKMQLFSDPGFKLTNSAPVPTKYLGKIILPKYLGYTGAQLVNLNPGSENRLRFSGLLFFWDSLFLGFV